MAGFSGGGGRRTADVGRKKVGGERADAYLETEEGATGSSVPLGSLHGSMPGSTRAGLSCTTAGSSDAAGIMKLTKLTRQTTDNNVLLEAKCESQGRQEQRGSRSRSGKSGTIAGLEKRSGDECKGTNTRSDPRSCSDEVSVAPSLSAAALKGRDAISTSEDRISNSGWTKGSFKPS